MEIQELPITESKRRFDIWEQECRAKVHPMNRSNIDEWITKDGKRWITVDNTAGQFYVEEFTRKEDAIKRLETYDETLLLNNN